MNKKICELFIFKSDNFLYKKKKIIRKLENSHFKQFRKYLKKKKEIILGRILLGLINFYIKKISAPCCIRLNHL